MNPLFILSQHSSSAVVSPSLRVEEKKRRGQAGFSLVEAACAMVVMLVALVGISATFTYAVNYNSGNNSRAQALAILQQEVERIRSKKFTPPPNGTDSELSGGKKADRTVIAPNGNRFLVKIKVDDDPSTAAIDVDNAKTLKEITVQVELDSPTPGWQTAIPATVILRRVRSN